MRTAKPPEPRKKVKLVEIAQAAGVSKSTVSIVLNDSPNAVPISEVTRARVLETARRLGYRPNAAARSLATGRSYTILMVGFDLWDQNLTERLRGAEARLVPHGYSIRMCTIDTTGGSASYQEILRSGQADGVLLTGIATRETYPIVSDLCEEAAAVGAHVVSLGHDFPQDPRISVVRIDDESASREAVTHLIQHGHRRIVLLAPDAEPRPQPRERGYRAAMDGAAIPIDPDLIVLGRRTQSWAYETALRLARSHDFSAMFATSDNLAVAAMAGLKAAGRSVPDDCAVVGFDNNQSMAKYTDPPLTTVQNPFYDAGTVAAEMLLSAISGVPYEREPLPLSLVIRRSCGCDGEA